MRYEKFNGGLLALTGTYKIEASLTAFKKQQYLNKIEAQITKKHLNNFLIILCLGGILLFRGIFEPYTKRRKLNIALREKNNQCFAAREKSEYLATSKSTFFSTVSPELRTPLYGVVGLSTILLEDPNLKSHNQDLKSLKFSADYLLALINDVLQIKWILTTLTRMKASLMDLNMPEMDGCEATKIIRELNKQIPIITLTALDIAEVRNDIYLAGMNDINSKPHEITEFTRVILKNLKDSKVVVSK